MNLNWFLSRTVRHATHMQKHVWKILCAQRDLLAPQAIEKVTESVEQIKKTCSSTTNRKVIEEQMGSLETVANKWLKPYPSAGLRENVEVLLVAIAVAMGIRTFFIQPFKIPTGSMQPTLFGITQENLIGNPDAPVPNKVSQFLNYWFNGVSYQHIVAGTDGRISGLENPPQRFLLFNLWQKFKIGDETRTVWFPPENLWRRTLFQDDTGQLMPMADYYNRVHSQLGEKNFRKGDDVIRLRVNSGDHLFVDRFTYNFRRPKRGEIIVFETKNIPLMATDQQGQFYIKRLVGLGGEKISIGDDRHLVIDGKRLDRTTPHFENVYSFDPSDPPMDSKYSGHVNGRGLAPLFPDAQTVREIPAGELMVMGDNTMNSADSRSWGSFPKDNVIGKSFFVYWPFGSQDGRKSRWGLSNH